MHRKYTALQAAPARSPITGPLYFPLDFSQTRTETETPADPLSQSPAASPAAPGRPGDVVHQRGRPRVSNSTGYSSWRPSRRKHNPKSRRNQTEAETESSGARCSPTPHPRSSPSHQPSRRPSSTRGGHRPGRLGRIRTTAGGILGKPSSVVCPGALFRYPGTAGLAHFGCFP